MAITTTVPARSSVGGMHPATRSARQVDADASGVVGSAELSNAALRTFLHGLPGVDAVGLAGRAGQLGSRSIKTSAKAWGLDAVISMIDLTTLEGGDTPGRVRSLVAKALNPQPGDGSCPRPAAVCVYGDLVGVAKDAVGDAPVAVAAVATGFPAGRAGMAARLADTQDAVEAGADEIDMVIDRGAFLAGDYRKVYEDIVAVRQVCQSRARAAHLKVILETGELATYDNVRRASWLAMLAGADFIKTSTGKVSPAATLPVTVVMLEAVRDFLAATGVQVGVKPAGGIRSAKDALRYLVAVNEVAGQAWLDPEFFRFGASSLLNDVLLQRLKLATGAYAGTDYVTID